jgi:hypothetical protein
MYKKSDIEMERARLVKISRSLIRLKHSLLADREINDVLPDTLIEFDAALQRGTLKSLSSNIAKDILDS